MKKLLNRKRLDKIFLITDQISILVAGISLGLGHYYISAALVILTAVPFIIGRKKIRIEYEETSDTQEKSNTV